MDACSEVTDCESANDSAIGIHSYIVTRNPDSHRRCVTCVYVSAVTSFA